VLDAMVAALNAASLPADDVAELGRSFFRFVVNDVPAGFGGFELYRREALLRSIVVLAEQRGKGVGRLIVERLVMRVREAGATRAWLITDSASRYFAKLGFHAVDRATAPPAILATRQAADICATTAPLMVRPV